jgi:hypothetical protein
MTMNFSKHMTLVKTALIMFFALPLVAFAGNPDRAGAAGATQLLINPWAQSSGLANSNMASITGVESTFLNIAGMAFVEKTEIAFTNTQYLVGTGIQINSFGLAQKMGNGGVLGLSVMAMSFGDIAVTTVDLPEGGIGNFRPTMSNIALSYAKSFSSRIYAGITARVVSESIANVGAQGIAFDAGIRYVTGDNDRLKFGIALRNVGAPMRFSGDGLTATATPDNGAFSLTVSQRSERYEMPSMLNIGVSYDIIALEDLRLTGNGQFISNSFTRDQFGVGVEFAWTERVILRGGYLWEEGITDDAMRMTAITGPGAGLTLQIPTGANQTMLGIDYAYRTTNPFGGIHSIGVHINM